MPRWPTPDCEKYYQFEYKKSGNIDARVFGFTTPAEDVRALLRSRAIPSVVLNRETPGCNYVSADHVECKSGDRGVSPSARYFRARTTIPRFFQVHLGDRDFGNADTDVRVLPFLTFCNELQLP